MMKSANFSKKQKLTVLQRAIEIVEATRQWRGREVKTIVGGVKNGRPAEVWLSHTRYGITLSLFVESPDDSLMGRFCSTHHIRDFVVGYFNPQKGWLVSKSATEDNYLVWNKAVNALIK